MTAAELAEIIAGEAETCDGWFPPINPDDIWEDDTLTPNEQALAFDLLTEVGMIEQDDEFEPW